jgi:magnesium chelatase accessory protein
VLMPSRLHRPHAHRAKLLAWRTAAASGVVPGLDRLLTYGVKTVMTPRRGVRLSARADPAARDLIRQAFSDVPGNANLAQSWAKCSRRWPHGAQEQLLELYPKLSMPVLLLWADRDRLHPLEIAEEAWRLIPSAQLRVLEWTGFLLAYDDPVGVAREISAFCG